MYYNFEAGWELVKQSFAVLRMDKELLVFPFLAGVASLVVMASFALPLLSHYGLDGIDRIIESEDPAVKAAALAYVFVFYLCMSFVTIFCNSALIGATVIRLQGGDPTVGDGLRVAIRRIVPIFAWAVVSATVGLILRVLESSRRSLLARAAASLFGMAWSIVTCLAVPVLVIEGLGPLKAIRRSASLLRETWGEQLVGNFSMGAIFFLAGAIGAVLFAGLGHTLAGWHGAVALAVIYLAFVAIVSRALGAIFKASVYYYATGNELPETLSAEIIESAFVPAE